MKSTTLAFAAFISAVLAQAPTLTELIASQDDLSTLGGALAAVPELAEAVSGLKDITILAPTNAAFEALLAQEGSAVSAAIKAQNVEAIAALLSYHVLNGTYASTDFSDIPAFGASLLTNAATVDGYAVANTALGQNVGLVLNGENATLLSGELQSANVVEAVCISHLLSFHSLTNSGHHGHPGHHHPQDRRSLDHPHQRLHDAVQASADRLQCCARRPHCG
jgi:uncharacterized surface protein with fasciclin (FAS1) repeats